MGGPVVQTKAQITFDSDGTTALKLRWHEAKILTFVFAQEKES
jgi:hypothetical protein